MPRPPPPAAALTISGYRRSVRPPGRWARRPRARSASPRACRRRDVARRPAARSRRVRPPRPLRRSRRSPRGTRSRGGSRRRPSRVRRGCAPPARGSGDLDGPSADARAASPCRRARRRRPCRGRARGGRNTRTAISPRLATSSLANRHRVRQPALMPEAHAGSSTTTCTYSCTTWRRASASASAPREPIGLGVEGRGRRLVLERRALRERRRRSDRGPAQRVRGVQRVTVDRFQAASLQVDGRAKARPVDRTYHEGYYAGPSSTSDGTNVEAV